MHDVGDNHLYDIRFNFVIGEFGIFEGRGWNAVPDPLPDIGSNYLYIGYISIESEEECKEFSKRLIENGIKFGKADEDFESEELVLETTTNSFSSTPEMTTIEATSEATSSLLRYAYL